MPVRRAALPVGRGACSLAAVPEALWGGTSTLLASHWDPMAAACRISDTTMVSFSGGFWGRIAAVCLLHPVTGRSSLIAALIRINGHIPSGVSRINKGEPN